MIPLKSFTVFVPEFPRWLLEVCHRRLYGLYLSGIYGEKRYENGQLGWRVDVELRPEQELIPPPVSSRKLQEEYVIPRPTTEQLYAEMTDEEKIKLVELWAKRVA